jgi:stage IV sporulation protein FB
VFGNVAPTPYDLRFRLFGFPVRVHPLFWLITALLGDFTLRNYGVIYLLLWVACVFVSILIHELGHALAARWYGSPCEIVLHALGGLAVYPYAPAPGWRRMAIALAGPAAGFALAGVVYLSSVVFGWQRGAELAAVTFGFLLWINLFWNFFNLLPIWPLDGGRVCREALFLAKVKQPDAMTYRVSLIVSAGMAVFAAAWSFGAIAWLRDVPFRPGIFTVLWFGIFAYENYQLLQAATRGANPRTW